MGRELACEIIKYGSGKNDKGWWGSAKMVEQVSFHDIMALFVALFVAALFVALFTAL